MLVCVCVCALCSAKCLLGEALVKSLYPPYIWKGQLGQIEYVSVLLHFVLPMCGWDNFAQLMDNHLIHQCFPPSMFQCVCARAYSHKQEAGKGQKRST